MSKKKKGCDHFFAYPHVNECVRYSKNTVQRSCLICGMFQTAKLKWVTKAKGDQT